MLLGALVVGSAVTPRTLGGDAGRTLATFLGLISASILPTISLLINSMTASGRSVSGIDRLLSELEAAIDALLFLFGCTGVALAALLALALDPPVLLMKVPYLTSQVLPRLGQAILIGAASMIVWRVGQIPAILRRSLKVRHEIAVDEARRKLGDKSPQPGAMRQAFATHPDFGKVVPLQDIQGREPH